MVFVSIILSSRLVEYNAEGRKSLKQTKDGILTFNITVTTFKREKIPARLVRTLYEFVKQIDM